MGKKGKFFLIRSKKKEKYVLDVKGEECEKDQKVQLYEEHRGDNQLWCYDYAFNVIRTRMNEDFCLDHDGEHLVINKFKEDKKSQRFILEDDKYIRQVNTGRVIDIEDGDFEEGTRLILYDFHGEDNQEFELKYTKPRKFMIQSKLCDKVMDIEDCDSEEGTDLIMFDPHGEKNQLWYCDMYGHIFSKLKDMTVTSEKDNIRIDHYKPIEKDHNWVIAGKRIVNLIDRKECFEIEDDNEDDGAKIVRKDYEGKKSQKWKYVYPGDDSGTDSD